MEDVGRAFVLAAGMAWQVGWSLVLGFMLSGLIQALVSKERMQRTLGQGGVRQIALATAAGAASSSCSYASAAIVRTLFKKGAALVPSLAFLFASTNLVLELGIVLWILLGWQFALAEWIGGIVLVIIMSILVKLTYPAKLVEAARHHPEGGSGHQHDMSPVAGHSLWAKLTNKALPVRVAQSFVMDVSMLWKDVLAGFLIAGFLGVFIPKDWWAGLFMTGSSAWIQTPVNALIGPIIAMLAFVCSIGNVAMAAILWGAGISFSGVLAFLYADLLVLPLLDTYRRHYGWKMAAYIALVFFVTMVSAALVMDLLFKGLGLVPPHSEDVQAAVTHFSLNYTFWLNIAFGAIAIGLVLINRRHPMRMHHRHEDQQEGDHGQG